MDLLCYLRLSESRGLPDEMRRKIVQKLKSAIDERVSKNSSEWHRYVLMPLDVVSSPESPFTDFLSAALSANLDYEIERLEKGTWALTWSWSDQFSDAWEEAAQKWKAVFMLRNVICIRRFGRFG